eukprot:CAMPEP_0171344752 /NCGR_PEP_ID=MMETSP0878-20121228/20059_1 /TAXON_ID=67004 /ORGANISM="Thalassiosira weissflogii, Strain CCMP1336" /LENGTH=447 /DNA_ID=CAMNT_0011848013 /DNA_START=258 /DNA_END=1601 /DNA_ORIENTATION=+
MDKRFFVLSRPMSFSGGLYNPGRKMIPFDSKNKPSHSFQSAEKKKKSPVKNEKNEFYSEVRKTSDVVESKEGGADKFIKGEVLDYSINLRTARPGTYIKIPYELTLTESLSDFWQSSFHSQDRIHTSTPFARALGLQDRVMPFSLVLFLTSAMSHEDSAKVQVGFGRCIYQWPVFAGDTVRKTFQVLSVRNTSDGNHSIIHFACNLINQRNRVCMSADKRLLFEFPVPESNVTIDADSEGVPQLFRDHLLSKSHVLSSGELESHSLIPLRQGNLILHTLVRSITFAQSQQLASLARLTHERHFDIRKYDVKTEIFVPAGLVLGLTMSAANRDFHEALHEELVNVSYVHHLHPGDVVSAFSYVSNVNENLPGDLESVTVRTIGVKNMDVVNDLDGVSIPMELLETDKTYTKAVEQICKNLCPKLANKVITVVDRKIIRQSNRREVFLL